MVTVIDPRRQMVINRFDYNEIKGAEAVDLETGDVNIREKDYLGKESHRTVHYSSGVRIVRRR